jgi:hypothetical protein
MGVWYDFFWSLNMTQLTLTRSQLATFDFSRAAGAMNTPSSQNLTTTLADVSRVLGHALVAGGMAVIHYGYERNTQDIDLLYANADEADILRRLKKDFKIVLKANSGWHHFEHRKTKVRLELIPEGGLTQFGFIPGPKTVGGENGFISLFGLVWMKLVSGRMKDDADIVEVAKSGQLSKMRQFAGKLPPELRERFNVLLTRAQQELDNDPHRLNKPRDSDSSVKESPAKYGKKKRIAIRSAKASKR